MTDNNRNMDSIDAVMTEKDIALLKKLKLSPHMIACMKRMAQPPPVGGGAFGPGESEDMRTGKALKARGLIAYEYATNGGFGHYVSYMYGLTELGHRVLGLIDMPTAPGSIEGDGDE